MSRRRLRDSVRTPLDSSKLVLPRPARSACSSFDMLIAFRASREFRARTFLMSSIAGGDVFIDYGPTLEDIAGMLI